MFNVFRVMILFLIITGVVACGGGGDSGGLVSVDTDGDGIFDSEDTDDDNDGVLDVNDAFPLDKTESSDVDADGIGDNTDTDNDNDGVEDVNDAFPLDPSESADADSDGLGNNIDPDDDNDSVRDEDDAFPYDASENTDTDLDGVGNNADNDDDNDGVEDESDIFPLDPNESVDTDTDGVGDNEDAYDTDGKCYLSSDGDGNDCYLTLLFPDGIETVKHSDNFSYIWFERQSKILALDHATGHFFASYLIDDTKTLVDFDFSSELNWLYVAYDDNSITYFSDSGEEINFLSLPTAVEKVISAGSLLVVESDLELHLYDRNGVLTDTLGFYKQSRSYAWDGANHRLFYFQDFLSSNSLFYVEINVISGEFLQEQQSAYNSSIGIDSPIILAPSGDKVLLGSGDLYELPSLDLEGNLSSAFTDALWSNSDELLLLSYISGESLLTRYDSDYQIVDQVIYPGYPLFVAGNEDQFVIFTREVGGLSLYAYQPSNDSDQDSVENLVDAFPLDIAASVDNDNDGYPDAWNDGYSDVDSTTNLSLDAFPDDSACWLSTHSTEEGGCDYAATMPVFTPDQTFTDENGVVYLFSEQNQVVYRWSISQASFIKPIYVGERNLFHSTAPSYFAYSSSHQRLYFAYDSGAITYVDALSPDGERAFATTASNIGGLVAVGNFVLAQDNSGAWNTHYIFDENGFQSDSKEWNRYSRQYTWNEVNNRVYFFRDQTSPNDLHYEEIDQITGEISAEGETPYHGDYSIRLPIVISNDGSLVLLGSGDLYDANDLTWQGSVGELNFALWLDNSDLLSIDQYDNRFTLTRQNADYIVVEYLEFDGVALGIFKSGLNTVIVRENNGVLVFDIYIPNDDSDNDGIDNLSDAFPVDVSASVDSDQDGYPDVWNDGYSDVDSTTNLTLDAFPDDSACWLSTHSTEEGGCDYAATMPVFTPDQTFTDENGVVYLFSELNQAVYRWSIAESSFINPIYVGEKSAIYSTSPSLVTYSHAHQRLYFAYDSGVITYVDALSPNGEQAFAQTTSNINGIAAVGNFVLVENGSRTIFDENGVMITTGQGFYSGGNSFAWNDSMSRVYFTRSGISPNDIHYAEIDQITGMVTSSGESPYHGDYSIRLPIVISNDGNLVLLGSGDLYDADDLTWQGSVGELNFALWLDDNDLLSIDQYDNRFTLTRQNADYIVVEYLEFDGVALGIFKSGLNTVIVRENNGVLVFDIYIPNDDSDNDGIDNLSDAFPVDVSASVDSDQDGYPDVWNDGYSDVDSTTNLTLDAFPDDSACWLSTHSTEEGGCDYAATMPVFTPDQTFTDENGVVYLFSELNQAVYRWSVSQSSFLNPIYVGEASTIYTASPSLATYSSAHQRLYFAYDSGAITYVDAVTPNGEQAFARTASSIGGLVAVGDFVLAQDNSGAWNTHYVFDENGVQTDSEDWNRYSRQYAWNEVNNRVYFFRDQTSPNDLHYEEIDQITGEITAEGETPYHSSNNILLPIRVIDNGQKILLGSGVIYDAESLEQVNSLQQTISDAIDFYDYLATLRKINNVSIVELRSYDDFSVIATFNYESDVVSILRYEETLIMVSDSDTGVNITHLYLGDSDEDLLPAWWELQFGLSDDFDDSGLDLDEDGVSNLDEFIVGSNPSLSDSDDDGLSDFDEINLYLTSPINADSDLDGLSDNDELTIYNTSPNMADSDADGFSDSQEIVIYLTDPNDALSVPSHLSEYTENFDGPLDSISWQMAVGSDESWSISDGFGSQLNRSLRSGSIIDNESSGVIFSALFSAGVLSFDAIVDAETCCDKLLVFVDDVLFHTISSNVEIVSYNLDLTEGEHSIEWRYQKDSSVSSGSDAAWIDNIEFQASSM